MKIPKPLQLPIVMVCITVIVCVILMILPIDQVLYSYEIVNGVKTVEFTPKLVGVLGYLGRSVFAAALWALIRGPVDKAVAQNCEYMSYRVIRFVINVVFFVWTSLMPALGILSIFEVYSA